MHIGLIQLRSAVKNRCIMLLVITDTRSHGRLMSPDTPAAAGTPRLTALPMEQAAALLRRSGSQRLTLDALRSDIAAGAPMNPDGTLNLIAYGAWLVRALAEREAGHGS